MESLLDGIEEALKTKTLTEKGAPTLITSGSPHVDLFAHMGSSRSNPAQLESLVEACFQLDPLKTMKLLYYLRNPRGGMGERSTFRHLISMLANHANPDMVSAVQANIGVTSRLGRFDDLHSLLSCDRSAIEGGMTIREHVIQYLAWILTLDINSLPKKVRKGLTLPDLTGPLEVSASAPKKLDWSITLLAKWLPSENASSKTTKALAKILRTSFKMTERQYRQVLSALRKRLKVVERRMSANKWGKIDYSHVPSKAALLYRNAFKKHDEKRYTQWIDDVAAGKDDVKVNQSVTFPHEITCLCRDPGQGWSYGGDDSPVTTSDLTFDEIKNLDNMFNALEEYSPGVNALPVLDVSGSMDTFVSDNSKVRAMDVCLGIGIYLSQRCTGLFKDHYLTFSSAPSLCKLEGDNIVEIVRNAEKANWGGTTNLQATFDLVLNTAKANNLPQEQMPEWMYIITDGEFDYQCGVKRWSDDDPYRELEPKETNYETIRKKFVAAGYTLPKIVFWNVNSRSCHAAMDKNDYGILASGYSPAILRPILQARHVSPEDVMEEAIADPAYDIVSAG